MSDSFETGDHPAYIGTMLFICACAVLLNILFIVVIYRVSQLRTSVDIFLTNLAASDILQAGVVLPVHFKNLSLHDEDFYGENAACKLVQFIPLFIVMAAISTIVVIAVDRFRVMLYRKTLYRWKSLVVVGLIWLVSCGISAPQLYEYSVYYKTNEETNRTQKVCGSEGLAEHFETVYAAAVFVLAYCVPLLILLICYTQISVLVWKHGKRFRSTDSEILNNDAATIRNSGQLETRISKRKVKVLKMLIAIAVSFIVLWTPYFILFAVQEVSDMDHTKDVGRWPHLVSRTMTILATVTDPAIYLFFSDPFRQYLTKNLPCCIPSSNLQQSQITTNDADQNQGPGLSQRIFHLRDKRRVEPTQNTVSTGCKSADSIAQIETTQSTVCTGCKRADGIAQVEPTQSTVCTGCKRADVIALVAE